MTKPKTTIEARRLLHFCEVIGARHLITATVGPNLDSVLLSLEQAPDYRIESPGWATFPKKRADSPNRFRIHHVISNNLWETIDLPETVENFHQIQPLGDGQWLLVRGRADDEADLNAHVYDGAGRHIRSFHAGDGIQDLQTTKDGRISVSYVVARPSNRLPLTDDRIASFSSAKTPCSPLASPTLYE